MIKAEDGEAYANTASNFDALNRMTLEQILSHGRTQRELGHIQAAASIFANARQRYTSSARAAYLLGLCLLDMNDGHGLEHLKYAMAQDETATGAACARAILFLQNHDDQETLNGYINRLAAWQTTSAAALDARERIACGDTLFAPSTERKHFATEALSQVKCSLACAYLVSKTLPDWFETPAEWLVVVQRGVSLSEHKGHVARTLQRTLVEHDLTGVRVLVLDRDEIGVLGALQQLDEACLWDHTQRVEHRMRSAGE